MVHPGDIVLSIHYAYFVLALNPEGDTENLKALYRRGQAFLGNKSWHSAASDLDRAVRLSAQDPSQQRLIREKLQEAKDQIGIMRANGTFDESGEHDVVSFNPNT